MLRIERTDIRSTLGPRPHRSWCCTIEWYLCFIFNFVFHRVFICFNYQALMVPDGRDPAGDVLFKFWRDPKAYIHSYSLCFRVSLRILLSLSSGLYILLCDDTVHIRFSFCNLKERERNWNALVISRVRVLCFLRISRWYFCVKLMFNLFVFYYCR